MKFVLHSIELLLLLLRRGAVGFLLARRRGQVKLEMLGSAERIVVMKEQTTIVTDDRNREAVVARIAQIRKDVEGSDSKV